MRGEGAVFRHPFISDVSLFSLLDIADFPTYKLCSDMQITNRYKVPDERKGDRRTRRKISMNGINAKGHNDIKYSRTRRVYTEYGISYKMRTRYTTTADKRQLRRTSPPDPQGPRRPQAGATRALGGDDRRVQRYWILFLNSQISGLFF